MNAFEYIDEMKHTIEKQRTDAINAGIKQVPIDTFYDSMSAMLDVLRQEMNNAEYNYNIVSINGESKQLDSHTLLERHLNDDVIIFQPIAIGEAELSAVDMQSLANVLSQLSQEGIIKENIVVLPPNINVFRATLVHDTID